DDLVEKARLYLENDELRESITVTAQQYVTEKHTYLARMKRLLDAVSSVQPRATNVRASSIAGAEALTSIVILTHNEWPITRLCLESIRRWTLEDHEIIVVDNGSDDETVSRLTEMQDVVLIENAENRGFAAAVNQGIRASRGRDVLLLNNDVVVTEGWLNRLRTALYSGPSIGMVGPCTNYTAGIQKVDAQYEGLDDLERFAEEWRKSNRGVAAYAPILMGFCLLAKRAVLDRVGYLDERFRIGFFEDNDLSLRVKKAGYQLLNVRDVFVHHFGSWTFRSTGVDIGSQLSANQCIYEEKWDSVLKPLFVGSDSKSSAMSGQPSKISMCMIARDNADTIEKALLSIRPWVDQMVVVDTGSKDATPEIAERCGAQVEFFEWCDDFAAARNTSLEHATGDWVFWMDSDDTMDEHNGRQLRELVATKQADSVVGFVIQVYCGDVSSDGLTIVDHVKLFRNDPAIRFEGRIHEQVLPSIRQMGGEIGWTDVHVHHSGADYSPEGRARKIKRDLRILAKDLADRPCHPFVLFNLGMTYECAGNSASAVGYLTECIEFSHTGESHLRKAYVYLVNAYERLGQFAEARKRCWEGLGRYPDDAELAFRLGQILMRSRDWREALAAFQRIRVKDANRYFTSRDSGITGHKLNFEKGICYEEIGRYEEAIRSWEVCLDELPEYEPAWDGLLRLSRNTGRTDFLRDFSENGGSHRHILVCQACIEHASGNIESAGKYFEKAVAIAKDNVWVLDEYARFLQSTEQWDRSNIVIKRLIELNPSNPSHHFNLGLSLYRVGRNHEAVESLERSQRRRPGHPPTQCLLRECQAAIEDTVGQR
ncbi:MAG: glycosyltransferase, partial [Rhodospirillales bacterium]|nr:glycosyltransferase [Rhodospirillales bacterium]